MFCQVLKPIKILINAVKALQMKLFRKLFSTYYNISLIITYVIIKEIYIIHNENNFSKSSKKYFYYNLLKLNNVYARRKIE